MSYECLRSLTPSLFVLLPFANHRRRLGFCRSFYGCCDIGEDNSWFPQYRGSNASALWLRDDNGKIAR